MVLNKYCAFCSSINRDWSESTPRDSIESAEKESRSSVINCRRFGDAHSDDASSDRQEFQQKAIQTPVSRFRHQTRKARNVWSTLAPWATQTPPFYCGFFASSILAQIHFLVHVSVVRFNLPTKRCHQIISFCNEQFFFLPHDKDPWWSSKNRYIALLPSNTMVPFLRQKSTIKLWVVMRSIGAAFELKTPRWLLRVLDCLFFHFFTSHPQYLRVVCYVRSMRCFFRVGRQWEADL